MFICENNEYGEYTPREATMAIKDVVDRAAGYGMTGKIVDGMDAIAVYDATAQAVALARAGEGPSFVECKTYRYYNHHGVQVLGMKYRSDEELAEWKLRDPIEMLERRMADMDVMSADEAAAVHTDIEAQVDAAIQFAEDSPAPDPSTLLDDVYTVGGAA